MDYQFKEYKKTDAIRNHLRMGGQNPSGQRIDVTNLYFERGGRPWIGVMGEFHFSRYSRDEWYEELCKMKAGGITIVATYLFWIYHEETEGKFDFSGDLDIRKFILDAGRAGLDAVIRIGPWAHGECRNGGFPDWLLKKPYKLRDNNEQYMAKARIWYEKIYEQVQGLFYKDGGNIIGVQFENELVDNAEHLLALKKLALEIGYDAPLYTVTGWNSKYGAKIPVDEVVPIFGAYAEAPWTDHIRKLPLSPHYVFNTMRNDSAVGTDIINDRSGDNWQLPYENYPYATCELGAGIQPTHHRRVVISGMDAYALSLVKLGCGNNLVGYYMYHGGTNKIGKLSTFNETKATGYPNDYTILNYDFHTALSQYGETREQYGLLNILHLFINDFGSELAVMENVEALHTVSQDDLTSLRYCMRTDGEKGFVFVNHYQRLAQIAEIENAVIDTGAVKFPPLNIRGEICFFMPFHMPLEGKVLEYATAQPLCRVENTWFFVEIPGIEAEYKIEAQVYREPDFTVNGTRIVTLTFEEARYARKLSGSLYIGEKCDVYECGGKICAVQDGDFSYRVWNGHGFDKNSVRREFTQAKAVFEASEEPFVPPYEEELNLGCERKRTWQKITVDGKEGLIEINYTGDAAQIYADGQLVADQFYCGEVWRVPADLLYGREAYLVYSEMKDDFYKEF